MDNSELIDWLEITVKRTSYEKMNHPFLPCIVDVPYVVTKKDKQAYKQIVALIKSGNE